MILTPFVHLSVGFPKEKRKLRVCWGSIQYVRAQRPKSPMQRFVRNRSSKALICAD